MVATDVGIAIMFAAAQPRCLVLRSLAALCHAARWVGDQRYGDTGVRMRDNGQGRRRQREGSNLRSTLRSVGVRAGTNGGVGWKGNWLRHSIGSWSRRARRAGRKPALVFDLRDVCLASRRCEVVRLRGPGFTIPFGSDL